MSETKYCGYSDHSNGNRTTSSINKTAISSIVLNGAPRGTDCVSIPSRVMQQQNVPGVSMEIIRLSECARIVLVE